jgi:hypothetical protein
MQGLFATGWHAFETLVGNSAGLAYNFRRAETLDLETTSPSIRRAKLMHVDPEVNSLPIVLVVDVKPEPDHQRSLCVQAHPIKGRVYLPPRLQLVVLDDAEQPFLAAQSHGTDNYMQLKFKGQPGERFSVRLAMDQEQVTEKFVI